MRYNHISVPLKRNFLGLVPGGETGWVMLTGAKPEPGSIDVGMFRFIGHEDPAWDWRTFDLDGDTTLIDKKAGFIDAVNPDLSAFRARGGKLLIYHGWNDGGSGGAISPLNSVNYYASVFQRKPLTMPYMLLLSPSGAGAEIAVRSYYWFLMA